MLIMFNRTVLCTEVFTAQHERFLNEVVFLHQKFVAEQAAQKDDNPDNK